MAIHQQTILALQQQIAAGRNKLQALWQGSGRIDSTLLAASAELDELINRYYRLPESGAELDSGECQY